MDIKLRLIGHQTSAPSNIATWSHPDLLTGADKFYDDGLIAV